MDIETATLRFSALGNPVRLSLFRLLVKAGARGLPAGVIASQLDIHPSTLTPHLQGLERCGLIMSQRQSRSMIYSLNPSGLQALVSYLVHDCCDGRPDLCGLTSEALEAMPA